MKKIVEITTVVVAVLLVITTTLIYLSGKMGFQVSTISLDSMSPTLEPGTMVVASKVDASTLKIGDIIVYKPVSVGENPIAHRIVEINKSNPPSFRTKGDNPNQVIDPWTVPAVNVIGRVDFSAPWVGNITSFFRSRAGMVLALVVPALILVIMVFKSFWRELVKFIRSTPAKEG